ncbi:MAG: NAD(P)H-hydrate dehydratase [Ruminococcus sp.]|nr:NAD(P)H-hydrate dehydratase [Ruminococcus sp.]
MYICTPEQMKQAENNAVSSGISLDTLMENAGAAAVKEIVKNIPRIAEGTALILCGKGNNGGDGFVIARLLDEMGTKVTVVLLFPEPQTGLAAEKLSLIRGRERINIISPGELSDESGFTLIADAVFGTGFHGELPDGVSALFKRINGMSGYKLAADIPSGADSVTGSVSEDTIFCDLTVTFGAAKQGMLLPPARQRCGRISVGEIGVTPECFEQVGNVPLLNDMELAASVIPQRDHRCHKGTFGRLAVIAGSENMSGAAALNVSAALRSGAGLVTLASVPPVTDRVGAGIYECTFEKMIPNENGAVSSANMPKILSLLKSSGAAAVGSGLTVCEDTVNIVKETVVFCGENKIPLILDADGLNCLTSCIDIIRNAKCRAVLTPHPGELARLLGEDISAVLSDRLSAAARLRDKTGAVIAAKGYPTYILSPDGEIRASYTGNGGLSRGGSGDVLTGVIAGITAMNGGRSLFECACAGVYLFGLAADIAARKLSVTGMLPSDVTAQLPFAFKQAEESRS